jgi:cysteine-rich repeat protein
MQLYKSALAALALGTMAVGGCSGAESAESKNPNSGKSDLGNLGMNLVLPDDSEITNVNYSITGPGGFVRSGVVPVANSSKLAFRVGNLPADTNGYTIALSATTSFGEPCQGSRMFNVVGNETTSVSVVLQCQATDNENDLIVDGTFESCPVVTSLQAIPAEAYIGSTMAFEALISHGVSAVTWSSTAGSFSTATAATSPYATTYTCPAAPGVYTITATVTGAGAACNDTLTMTVECSQTIACGDGVFDPATEQCDDGNTVDSDDCRVGCIPNTCGDGILRTSGATPVEECDAIALPNATCNAACELIVCGDNVREGDETCDDGNTTPGDGCSAGCRVEGCGDGVVLAPETCDDQNTVDGDECTNGCRIAVCGDGVRRTVGANPEACDDGNTNNDDECRNDCTVPPQVIEDLANNEAGCETCRAGNCRDFDGFDAVGNCFLTQADPLAAQACVDLRDCMFTNNSGYDPTIGPIQSFCGTADVASTCGEAAGGAPSANGPCRLEWAVATSVCASAETCTLASIGTTAQVQLILGRASSPNRPSGAATSLTLCDAANCSPSCTP